MIICLKQCLFIAVYSTFAATYNHVLTIYLSFFCVATCRVYLGITVYKEQLL